MHQPVLKDTVLEYLVTDPSGLYLDATFGRGGHTQALLARLSPNGRVIAVDRDDEAIAYGKANITDARLTLVHQSFANVLDTPVIAEQIGCFSGILLDLGVSSPQLDTDSRGFSFMRDGPLDMRMDTTQGMTAAEWLVTASVADICKVLRDYGEEKAAYKIALKIVQHREKGLPLETTGQLASLIKQCLPYQRDKHPATRTFQAIRIFINQELQALEQVLVHALKLLKPEGHLVVISFHSLEDRIVKRFLRHAARGTLEGSWEALPWSKPQVNLLTKPLRASEEEVQQNPRARSAILRAAQKLKE